MNIVELYHIIGPAQMTQLERIWVTKSNCNPTRPIRLQGPRRRGPLHTQMISHSLEHLLLTLFNSCIPDKMVAVSQMIFPDAFMRMKNVYFNYNFTKFFLSVRLTIWLVPEQGMNHYLNQCWSSSQTHICSKQGDELSANLARTKNHIHVLRDV